MTHGKHQSSTLARQAREIWERNSVYWDSHMGEGNAFHLQLIRPAVEGLLAPRPGETVLDLACGNGLYARHLADLGCNVVACDFSEALIELAARREPGRNRSHPIEYQVVDAAEPEQLATLGRDRFDAIVCNMSIMDIVDINPLFEAVPRMLKPEGRFVFTIMHPCFNHTEAAFESALDELVAPPAVRHSLRISNYLDIPPRKGLGVEGQPEMHYYFHRPLSDILNLAFAHGMMMDGIMEPAFPVEAQDDHRHSWRHFPTIPLVLAARFRQSLRNW
ncbi:MAG: class I SAM-dependent methyltransferase [Chloroflexia bacterium]|jgi:2-polyprenyl-3-methyl-5-hydroxy-6-metoxy-1,4-benzoquinol methylase|nr:class I SAM-dependent methyltransferase [Chloroflexia bacterium]